LAFLPAWFDDARRSLAHLAHQRVGDFKIGVDVLHISFKSFSPASSSTGTVFCGFQVNAALRASRKLARQIFNLRLRRTRHRH
jgi:hypothetical protein